jgi:Zn-dependent peptidase ImmA (M78 family)
VFNRGFKNWCETISLQRRRALKLKPIDPLDPEILAASLKVEVHSIDEVPGLSHQTIHALTIADSGSWSAVTLTNGLKSVVILNSGRSRGRSASDLMHELAHIIIGHNPGRVDITEDGSLILNTYERQQEDEANWLAGSLLLPREALLWIKRQGWDLAAAAKQYGVSLTMLQYRLNVTGVEYQLQRAGGFTRNRR